MNDFNFKRKAVALISGGLDSLLAAKLIIDQGIEVHGLNFYTGFCIEGHTKNIRNRDSKKVPRNNALWVAEQLNIKLSILDIIEEYKNVVINPKHGYGSNLNPCIDCKILMLEKAKEWMVENGYDFIITGEVVGQRPMTQKISSMSVIERESKVTDILVRPLSALNLEETYPETMGWVDRSKLLGITGRSRKLQIDLAKRYGFHDFAQPAGGCCFLTDAQYSNRLQDFWEHKGSKDYDFDDIILLKVGRHLRLSDRFKIIIARDGGESNYLSGYKNRFKTIRTVTHPGPVCLLIGNPTEEEIDLAASIVARYSKGKDSPSVMVEIINDEDNSHVFAIKPIAADQIANQWML